jgi:hypothetical protein
LNRHTRTDTEDQLVVEAPNLSRFTFGGGVIVQANPALGGLKVEGVVRSVWPCFDCILGDLALSSAYSTRGRR